VLSSIIRKSTPASTKNRQVVITLEVLVSFFVMLVVVVTLIVIERLVAGVKRVVVVTLAIKFLLFLLQMFLSMRC
jgi:threonine/homoserine/homoserine lactone efflux protein